MFDWNAIDMGSIALAEQESMGFTAAQMAEAMGVEQARYKALTCEAGDDWSLDEAVRLSSVCGGSLDDLLGLRDATLEEFRIEVARQCFLNVAGSIRVITRAMEGHEGDRCEATCFTEPLELLAEYLEGVAREELGRRL